MATSSETGGVVPSYHNVFSQDAKPRKKAETVEPHQYPHREIHHKEVKSMPQSSALHGRTIDQATIFQNSSKTPDTRSSKIKSRIT